MMRLIHNDVFKLIWTITIKFFFHRLNRRKQIISFITLLISGQKPHFILGDTYYLRKRLHRLFQNHFPMN